MRSLRINLASLVTIVSLSLLYSLPTMAQEHSDCDNLCRNRANNLTTDTIKKCGNGCGQNCKPGKWQQNNTNSCSGDPYNPEAVCNYQYGYRIYSGSSCSPSSLCWGDLSYRYLREGSGEECTHLNSIPQNRPYGSWQRCP